MEDEATVQPPFEIRVARTERDFAAAKILFTAYAASLHLDLNYQGFDAELDDLSGIYAPPEGALFLAWDAINRPVACVGLRSLHDREICEMKRLYVALEARSFGLGRALTEVVIQTARDRGYTLLRLDTLPSMDIAARLYEKMGFHRISSYYGPTPPGTIFMELDLQT